MARASHVFGVAPGAVVAKPATGAETAAGAFPAARTGGDELSSLGRAEADGDPTTVVGLLLAERETPSDSAHPVRPDERQVANDEPIHDSQLGPILERKGDVEGALAAYRRADAGGDAAAATNLGVLLEQQGDLHGAVAAYKRAEARGDANGSFNLGCLLSQLGDMQGAIAALRRADERGDPAAASNLGVLLEHQGDVDGALAAYRRADERGDANGAFNLGLLLANHGDGLGAQDAYRRAVELGDRELAKQARKALAELKPRRFARATRM